jgi:beta-glucosidase-like glycosyl hydrolase
MQSINEGLTDWAHVDAAISRTLTKKFEVGLFDPLEQQVYTTYGMDMIHSADHLATAYEAALQVSCICLVMARWQCWTPLVQGMVLLKNAGAALPLKPGRNIAVVGPHANYSSGLMGGTDINNLYLH